MPPVTDASSAFVQDQIGRHRGRPGGLGPAIGLWLASVSSIVLWEALVHIGRWAAHSLL